MTETTNYKLKKPGDSDNVRVDVLNGNMDVIDRELKQRAGLGPDGKVPAEQLPEMDVSQTLAQAELKPTPADGDGVLVTDSAAGNATKRVLWSRIKAALSELYAGKSHSHAWGTITGRPGSFPPAAHASTHGSGGADPVTPAAIGAAAKTHTHSKSQITDFPSSLPANGGNAATVGGLSPDQLIAQAVAKGCRIATGSYVGTGTWGESSPNKLSFPFAPKVVFVVQYFESTSGVYGPLYASQKPSNAVMVADTLTESFQSGNGFYELGYINDEARYSYGKKSKDGKTFYWYFSYDKDRSSSQLNGSGDVYYWVAVG